MDAQELDWLFRGHEDRMTPTQRVQAYAAGEEVDYIPFSIQSNEEAMAALFGYTTAQWRDDVQVHIDIIARRREEFGIVGLSMGQRLRTVGQAVGSKIFFPEVGIDRIEQTAIQTLDELGKVIDNDPFDNPVYLRRMERARALKDAFPEMSIGTSVAGPVTVASTILPIATLMRAMRRDPDGVRELLDFAVYHSVSWVQMFAKEFGEVACNIADPVSCADILGRAKYLELSMPYQEKLIAGIREATGRKPSLHICGKTNPLWDDMKQLQVASFSVDNRESLADARERMGDTFMLVGNVPPVDVMLHGSIDEVIESCRDCILQGAESPCGYSLSTGCQVPIGVPRENFQAFIYAARTYGRGAQKGRLPQGMQE